MAQTTSKRKTRPVVDKKSDFKQMKKNSDVQGFYRFVKSSSLRREAFLMMSHVVDRLKSASRKKRKKTVH